MSFRPARRRRPKDRGESAWDALFARRSRDWCPHNRFVDWLTAPGVVRWHPHLPLLLAAWVGLAWLGFHWPSTWLLAPCLGGLGWLAGRWLGRRRIKGWQVVRSGLRELRWSGPPRLHPWAIIQEVSETPSAILVATANGTLRLPGRARGAAGLLRRLRHGLEADEPGQQVVSPDTMAAWMGLEAGEVVKLSPQPATWFGTGGCLIYSIAPWVALNSAAGTVVCVIAMALWVEWKLRPYLATPEGLRRGSWQASWEDLQIVDAGLDGWRLADEGGRVLFDIGPVDRLAEAMRRLYEARQAGYGLPRMGDVPEGALSRAEGVEAGAERGISVAEDGS